MPDLKCIAAGRYVTEQRLAMHEVETLILVATQLVANDLHVATKSHGLSFDQQETHQGRG
jgi:hypothetical protein